MQLATSAERDELPFSSASDRRQAIPISGIPRCIRINAADEDRKQWAHLTEKYGLEF